MAMFTLDDYTFNETYVVEMTKLWMAVSNIGNRDWMSCTILWLTFNNGIEN